MCNDDVDADDIDEQNDDDESALPMSTAQLLSTRPRCCSPCTKLLSDGAVPSLLGIWSMMYSCAAFIDLWSSYLRKLCTVGPGTFERRNEYAVTLGRKIVERCQVLPDLVLTDDVVVKLPSRTCINKWSLLIEPSFFEYEFGTCVISIVSLTSGSTSERLERRRRARRRGVMTSLHLPVSELIILRL